MVESITAVPGVDPEEVESAPPEEECERRGASERGRGPALAGMWLGGKLDSEADGKLFAGLHFNVCRHDSESRVKRRTTYDVRPPPREEVDWTP